MTQMRHDAVADALRQVVSVCSCESAAELCYGALDGHQPEGMVECQRRGSIVTVLPRLELGAMDVVVEHASAKSYAAQAAKEAGGTAARAEQTKRTRFRKDVPDHITLHACCVPVCAGCGGHARVQGEASGALGTLRLRLREYYAFPKGASVCCAVQMLPV